ncbi:Alpha-D-kanosaminyltransferase [Stieleria maiorica]|uniref:Alpha-D-kanosaminyltransferase n=1 Tax=Stieleria maiorica TaxID=2795974 RepID=A0A5B9MLE1_9BACT|nr:glycosyltransferase [Stieleria maiorica]QEG02192.1 Alpha-D-kanosaminyltransferase [Stieleria maiorica]
MNARHVVHISLGTQVGGMEKLLVEFARFTDRSRYRLSFVSLQRRGELAAEIESHRWPVIAMNKAEGLKPALVGRLAKTLRRMVPDVVHTHNTAAYVYGVAAARLAGVPRVIHTRHGQRFESSRRQTTLFRGLSRWVDRVVSVSSDGARLSVDEGIAADKTVTIFNGVDLDRFAMVHQRPRGRAVVVARLSPEKDVASLIHAIRVAKQNGRRLELDIIGDGSERPHLESLTQSFHLCDQIRFHGIRDDIPVVLAQASMFVLPSVTEGISLTLLEAMATGLPVVACDVGGNPEVVADGRTGILVPPRDPAALAGAIRRLDEDRDLARRFGSEGRARVESKFCVRKMVHAYQQLYSAEAA